MLGLRGQLLNCTDTMEALTAKVAKKNREGREDSTKIELRWENQIYE